MEIFELMQKYVPAYLLLLLIQPILINCITLDQISFQAPGYPLPELGSFLLKMDQMKSMNSFAANTERYKFK